METAIQFASLLGFGFLFGLQHAADPDHLVAITSLNARRESAGRRGAILGAWWGLGHTTTLVLAGVVVLIFQFSIPEPVALGFELAVGLLIIGLGARLLRDLWTGRLHRHEHEHDGLRHEHLHQHARQESHRHGHLSFATGLLHGLAGSAALSLLAATRTESLTQGVGFLLFFGLGSLCGMALFSAAIFFPLRLAPASASLQRGIRTSVGFASLGFGGWLVWEVGVGQGLLV